MSTPISVEMAERDLRGLLERLPLGETVTLFDPEGVPLAILVSLKSQPTSSQPVSDWQTQWEIFAKQVSDTWNAEQSALETLAEMRR